MIRNKMVLMIFVLFVFSNVCKAASLVDRGIYLLGNGDPDTAFKLFNQSCNKGDMKGCERLGEAYINSSGTKQNCYKALNPLKKACDHKLARACADLSLVYSGAVDGCNSEYVQDYMGNSGGPDTTLLRFQACLNAGNNQTTCRKKIEEESTKQPVKEINRYVKEDDSKSTYYVERACHYGIALSCWGAGYAYVIGMGVKKSIPKALFFYRKGCRMGNRKACHYYQTLKYQNE